MKKSSSRKTSAKPRRTKPRPATATGVKRTSKPRKSSY